MTFLVNIWLNHHPLDVHPFPETMIDKMSGHNNSEDSVVIDRRRHLEFRCCCEEPSGTHIQSVSVSSTTVTEHTGTLRNDDANDENDACYTPTKFVWPLGDASCQERLELQIPLRSIRNDAVQGGNLSITWSRGDESMKEGTPSRLHREQGDKNDETGDACDPAKTGGGTEECGQHGKNKRDRTNS